MSKMSGILGLTCYSLCLLGALVSCSPTAATTLAKTIPQCESVSCPPLNCQNPVRTNGQCCAVCPPDTEDSLVNSSRCIFRGLLIQHGHMFHPSLLDHQYDEGDSNPYCTSCMCSNGIIECKNHSLECPVLNCPVPVILPEGNCCSVCPSSLAIATSEVPSSKPSACSDIDGRTFSEGEEWHPSYPPHGLATCINCTCVNSKSQCVKLPCPAGPLPPCGPEEETKLVVCCRKCERVPLTTTIRQPPVDATSSEPSAITITPVVLTTCSRAYSVKVWRIEHKDALALEDTSSPTPAGSTVLTIWSWQNLNGSYSYTKTSETATNIQLATNYVFVGWTKPARVRRLSTASKQQKINRCASNCYRVLSQLLRVRQDCDGAR